MKKPVLLYLVFLLFLFLLAGSVSASQTVTSFSQIESLFQNPPVEYSSAPLWVWNNDVDEKEIDLQLQEMQQGGIHSVFIHPRPGLKTPYLSDRWYQLCKYTVDKAKERDMDVWLYDENSYPSGFAGGNVPAQMPESYNQGQGLVMEQASQLSGDMGNYAFILKKEGDVFTDITTTVRNELNKNGDYYLFKKTYYGKSPWNGGYSYVDLLYPGVTEKFIDVTMTGYEKAIGKDFGKRVPGIFTDEPNISPPGGIKYTPTLFDDFEKQWGYDLKLHLPSLYQEVGDWKVVRHNYYSLLLELFTERWSKLWYEYCENHNLKWTGHYWDHDWPKPLNGSDNMAMYAWHQVPAIDLLMNQYSESVNGQFGNVRIVKELASVANQLGRTRTLSETYGAGGWDLTFEDMKRIGEWEYVLGVNFLDQHLSYITIAGARKRDHPQSFSYHEPWWKFYKSQGDYFSRLSVALSSGKQVNDILVLEPTTTSWLYFSPTQPNLQYDKLGPVFQKFVTDLEAYQVEYDLGSEYIIKNWGKVKGNEFIIGERAYKQIIIPPSFENYNKDVLDLLKTYTDNGGEVISFNGSPQYVNGKNATDLGFTQKWNYVQSLSPAVLKKLESETIQFQSPENAGGKLFHHRRILDDGQLVYLVNTDLQNWSIGSFTLQAKSLQELDPQTGSFSPYPAAQNGNNLDVSFDIPPAGSLLLYAGNTGETFTASQKKAEFRILDPVTKMDIKRLAPNTLVLDFCDLTLEGKTDKDIYFFKAADKVFRHYGFEGNPWSTSVQYKSAILDRDNFSKDTGFSAVFHFDVDKNVNTNAIKAAIERPELWTVTINGNPVKATEGECWLDRAIGVYEIGSYIKPGENQIRLAVSPMSVHAELEPIYLLGDFNLESQDKGWKLVPSQKLLLDSWKNQGIPFYSDGVEYTSTYTLDSKDKRYVVKLADWAGSVAEIQVNGNPAGLVYSPPYELDVTDFTKPGKNQISVSVYGTLKNQLGPHHIGNTRGSAWPSSFEAAPEHEPAGNDYNFIDYGLFKNFIVIEISGPQQRVYWRNYKVAKPEFASVQSLYVDSPATISLNCATDGAEIHYTLDGSDPQLSSTKYSKPFIVEKSTAIKAQAFKKGKIESDIAEQSINIVSSKKNGVSYKYYEGFWNDIPDFEKLAAIKSGKSYEMDISKLKQRNTQFAFIFNTNLEIDEGGTYTFYLNSNDGSMLYIDGKLVVDNGGAHGLQERQGNVILEPGKHAILIHYFDGGGSQAFEISYKGPELEKQLLKLDKLFVD